MLELIALLIFNSLLIIGIYNAVDYELNVDRKPVNKQVLWWVKWYTRKMPDFFKDPLYSCIMCMASVHSLYVYWFVYDFTLYNVCIYIFYIFALSGLNKLIYGSFFK